MKLKAKNKDCKLNVRVKTSFREKIDEKELERFVRVFLRGFLKPKIIKKNIVEYTGPIGISLYERFKKPISKKEFLFIIEQIVVAIQKIQVNNFKIAHLILSLQHVYINEITKEIQFIYFPTMIDNDNNLTEFIENIVYSVIPLEKENDDEFVARFMYYFKSLKIFNILELEKFILKEDMSIVNTIRKMNIGQSGFITDKQQHYFEHYDDNSDDKTELLIEGDEATELLEDDETGLLTEEDDETGLLVEENVETGLLNKENINIHYPLIFRVLTNENIYINKSVFRIGKEKSCVDYFITDNISVSRNHADIITRGNKFFVKDLNSKNNTYVNGKKVSAYMEIEISDGDELKFSNEEFVFYKTNVR